MGLFLPIIIFRLYDGPFLTFRAAEDLFQRTAETVEGGLRHRAVILFPDFFVELRAVAVLEWELFGYVFLYLGTDRGGDARVIDLDVWRLLREIAGQALRVGRSLLLESEPPDFFFEESETICQSVGLFATVHAVAAGAADRGEYFVRDPALESLKLLDTFLNLSCGWELLFCGLHVKEQQSKDLIH